MSTYWDDFLEEHKEKLSAGRRELLKLFYHWLVEKGVIHD